MSFSRGTIKQIKLHNFMTYADVTITPGPGLNVLCAPNGTGKSTIACALCIGLGFSAKLLGRADNVKDFIRRGQASGWVQICLSEGEGRRDCVVKRVIEHGQDLVRGTSTWFLQGLQTSEREAKQRISQFNLQLDNLCQFLPQDKVVEFARLGPEDLLKETEKAIGQSELHEQHLKLIEQRKRMLETERQTGVIEQQLQQAEQQLQDMERDVERFERRKQLLEEISWLKKKSLWIKFEQHQENLREMKKNYDDAVKDLKELQERVQRDQNPLKQQEKRIKDAKQKKGAAMAQYQRAETELEEVYLARVTELQTQIEAASRDLNNLNQLSQTHRKKIQDLIADIEEGQKKLQDYDDAQTNENEHQHLQQLQQKIHEIDDQLNEQENKQQTSEETLSELNRQKLNHSKRLKDFEDQKFQKLKKLDKASPGILEAYKKVQQARQNQMFKDQVLGPILLEISVGSRLHASFLEQACAQSLWSAFVTQCREDQDALLKLINNENFNPSIINFNDDPNRPIKYAVDPQQLPPELGIETTLDKLVQAPPIIKQVLCEESGINFVYIGSHQTDNTFETVFQNFGQINRIFTPSNAYNRIRSKYNRNASSTTIQSCRDARMLAPEASIDEQQVRHDISMHIERIQKSIQQVKQEKQQLEENINKLNSDKKLAMDGQQKIRKKTNERRQYKQSLQGNLDSRQRQLQRLQNEPDPMDREQEIKDRSNNDMEELVASLGRLTDQQQICWELFQQINNFSLIEIEATSILHSLERAVDHDNQLLQVAQRTVDQINNQVRRLREECKQAKTVATRECQYTDEVKEKFQEFPNDLEEIRLSMVEKQAQADGIVCNDDGVLARYRQLQQQVADYRDQVENGQQRRERVQQNLNNMRDTWITQLKTQVGVINNTFKDSFSQIGCAGEVQVFEHPDGDFEKFGVQIKVQFRESEEAEVLSAQRQSGGERSVATMLYLLSLQSITNCPFRVVDEINQGMDPINERKVFDLLVASSLLPDTPQCFLLTPKLLPELGMKKGVSSLVIFNGMQPSKDFKLSIRDLVAPARG